LGTLTKGGAIRQTTKNEPEACQSFFVVNGCCKNLKINGFVHVWVFKLFSTTLECMRKLTFYSLLFHVLEAGYLSCELNSGDLEDYQ
jgi:hypothetical protein